MDNHSSWSCPVCSNTEYETKIKRLSHPKGYAVLITETYYVCTHCGHRMTPSADSMQQTV